METTLFPRFESLLRSIDRASLEAEFAQPNCLPIDSTSHRGKRLDVPLFVGKAREATMRRELNLFSAEVSA